MSPTALNKRERSSLTKVGELFFVYLFGVSLGVIRFGNRHALIGRPLDGRDLNGLRVSFDYKLACLSY